MSSERGLPFIQVWASDLLAHVWKTREPMEVLGARVMLWSISAEEDPVGTLPDDPALWAAWCGCSEETMMGLFDRLTASWRINANGRWVIRRIVDQKENYDRKSRAAKKAGKASGKSRKVKSTNVERTLNERSTDVELTLNPLTPTLTPTPTPSLTPTPTPTPTPTSTEEYCPDKSHLEGQTLPESETFERYWTTCDKHGTNKSQAAKLWPGFLDFWASHPNRTGKLRAWSAWIKHKPPADEVLAALEWQKADPGRSRDGYKFFKRPEAWLNAASWEDAPPDTSPIARDEIPKNMQGAWDLLQERAMEETDGQDA